MEAYMENIGVPDAGINLVYQRPIIANPEAKRGAIWLDRPIGYVVKTPGQFGHHPR